jgi:replication factor C subunit 1
MKASSVTAPKAAPKEVPDLEEAIEEDDNEALEAPEVDEDEEIDLKKDKYIKQPKAKKPTKKPAKKKADDDDDDDEADKPKKAAKGKASAAKGRGKK